MKKLHLNRIGQWVCLLAVIAVASCETKESEPTQPTFKKNEQSFYGRLNEPIHNSLLPQGDSLKIHFSCRDLSQVDSMIFFENGQRVFATKAQEDFRLYWKPKQEKMGTLRFKAILLHKNGYEETKLSTMEIVSNIQPVDYTVRVLRSYPHDIESYTQGLEFHDGILYEGTGSAEHYISKIRKVNYKNGEVLKEHQLPKSIFGEGITIYKDKLYQLTYRARTCFVYDLHTFEELNQFKFGNSTNEGWGMQHYKDWLIMTDGSHEIRFMDPETFKEVKKIEVFNDKGKINFLNELEVVNGEIWANVYTTNKIIRINAESGKVQGIIHLDGIEHQISNPRKDVLNGIAFDHVSRKLLVTGKLWDKIFEIELVNTQ